MAKKDINTIQELADYAYGFFHKVTKPTGEIWVYKDNTPEWIKEMTRAAHAEMGPDDWKYEFVVEALAHISDASDEDVESPQLEPDAYTGELLAWLASNLNRPFYVDEAVHEFGHSDQGIIGDIMTGQVKEKEEVYYSVFRSLDKQLGGSV